MAITSQDICNAADQLKGFVGFHGKRGVHIVRFSEDAFGMDVADASITPAASLSGGPSKGSAWRCAANGCRCCWISMWMTA